MARGDLREPDPARDVGDFALVRRIAVAVQERDRDRAVALLKEVLAELGASCRDLRVDLRSLEAQYHQLHGVFLKHMQTESDERRFNRLINSIFLLIEDIKACLP